MSKAKIHMPYALRFLLRQAGAFVLGGLFAQTRLFGGLPSFAVALAAASPKDCILSVCLGEAGGSFLFTDDVLTSLVGAAAAASCGMICFALQTVTQTDIGAAGAAAAACLCCAAAGATTLLGGGVYLSGVLQYLCDSILAGSAAFFFARTRTGGLLLRQSVFPSCTEALAPAAAISILLLSVSFIHVYVFVPARMAAAILILLCAWMYAEAGGAAAGILCGVTMEIACDTPGLACCFALGGLCAGLAGRRRSVYVPLCMTGIAALYPLLTQSRDAAAVFAETAAACAIFLLIPKKALHRLRPVSQSGAQSAERQDTALRDTLYKTAAAAAQISPAIVRQQLRQGVIPGTRRMTARVRELACSDCAGCLLCWETQQTQTENALAQAFARVHKCGSLSPDTLPPFLQSNCTRRNMVSSACVQAYEELSLARENESLPDGQDPFSAAAALLRDAASHMDGERRRLPRESEDALHLLRTYGVPAASASCFVQDGRYTVLATADPCVQTVKKSALTASLGKLCGCAFALPTVTASGKSFRWCFTQSVRYRLRTGTAQEAADGKHCGDFFLTFAQDGRQVFLLSDGMGTGLQAQLDAEVTAEIFASLLRAGVGADCALTMVNEALRRREDTESAATLDMVQVDLYTGRATFCKAGAAPSYLLHDGKAECIDMPGMPVGILAGVQFQKSERTLHKGDVFVMMSDGVCTQDLPVRFSLGKFDGGSANTLAQTILQRALPQDARNDDATVLAIVVE